MTSLRQVARELWWRLPSSLRDALRPLLLRPRLFPPIRGRRSELVRPRATVARPSPAVALRLQQRVSVIIPTRDAGPLFGRVLAGLRQQDGLEQLELIVVDSGSTDGTRELAAGAGAQVIDVRPEDFGHGRTRNVGAEAAGGDVLVLLVQDAVPLGREMLHQLVAELHEGIEIAAISARQVPRSDADLYGSFVVFAHDELMRGPSSARGARRDRRVLAAVDNVCAAVRRSAWEELRFADVPFAEDLEFGLRALHRGWTVRTSRRAAVAHSHNRGAEYHFRRNVADRIYVAGLFGDTRYVRAAEGGVDAVRESVRPLVAEVQSVLDSLPPEADLAGHVTAVRSGLRARPGSASPRGQLARLAVVAGSAKPGSEATVGLLRDDLATVLGWRTLASFARAQRSVTRGEAAGFVAKAAASVVGRAVGDALRRDGVERASQLVKGL